MKNEKEFKMVKEINEKTLQKGDRVEIDSEGVVGGFISSINLAPKEMFDINYVRKNRIKIKKQIILHLDEDKIMKMNENNF